MTHMDLLPSDEEQELGHIARAAFEKLCTPSRLNLMYDDPVGEGRKLPEAIHSLIARDLGIAGLLIPEDLQGAGGNARDAAAVLTEIGRACAPGNFLTNSVIAVTALVAIGDSSLLPKIASGEIVAALTAPTALNGELANVIGLPADVLLIPVPAPTPEDPRRLRLHAVEATSVRASLIPSLDMTRPIHDIVLDGAPGTVLSEHASPAIDLALRAGAGLLASEQVGVANWCLETTIEYLNQRRQFGRIVGSFQSLKHRLADLYGEIAGAGAAAAYAADCLATNSPDTAIAVSVAKSYCSEVAVHAAEEALQLHGGIGMTWEHPIHIRLGRAKADQLILGTGEQHRRRLAGLIDLPMPPSSGSN